jgi:hypothetical protein
MKAEIAGKLPSHMCSVGNQHKNGTPILAIFSVSFSVFVSNLSCYNLTTPVLATKGHIVTERD